MKKDGWEADDHGLFWKKTLRIRKWPSLGIEVRTELCRMANNDPDEKPFEMKTAYTLDSGDYVGNPKIMIKFIRKYGIRPEVADSDDSVCSIGFSNRNKQWYGWSHRAVSGFKPGDIVKKGDILAKSAGGPFKSGYEIKDMKAAKDAAVQFASLVSHNLKDSSKLMMERLKKDSKPLKDFELGYDIEGYNGEEINDEDPTFLAVKTPEVEEIKEVNVTGWNNQDVSTGDVDRVHAMNAAYPKPEPEVEEEPEEEPKPKTKGRKRKTVILRKNKHLQLREAIQRKLKEFGVI
jgi:hypothetical protein